SFGHYALAEAAWRGSKSRGFARVARSYGDRGSVAVVAGPDGAVVDLDRELDRRLVGRGAQGAAVAHVELRAVQDAFDGAGGRVEVTGRQLEVLVAAAVFKRVEVAVVVEHQDRGVAVPGDLHFAGEQFGGRADAGPAVGLRAGHARGF